MSSIVISSDHIDGLAIFCELLATFDSVRNLGSTGRAVAWVFDVDKGIIVEMAVWPTRDVRVLSPRLPGGVQAHIKSPFLLMTTFGRTGYYGATNEGYPSVVAIETKTASEFAVLCLRTLINEWISRFPDIPFPLLNKRLKLPDGNELLADDLILPQLPE